MRGHRFRVVEDTLGVSIVGLLQVGINEELVGVDFVCNSSQRVFFCILGNAMWMMQEEPKRKNTQKGFFIYLD